MEVLLKQRVEKTSISNAKKAKFFLHYTERRMFIYIVGVKCK